MENSALERLKKIAVRNAGETVSEITHASEEKPFELSEDSIIEDSHATGEVDAEYEEIVEEEETHAQNEHASVQGSPSIVHEDFSQTIVTSAEESTGESEKENETEETALVSRNHDIVEQGNAVSNIESSVHGKVSESEQIISVTIGDFPSSRSILGARDASGSNPVNQDRAIENMRQAMDLASQESHVDDVSHMPEDKEPPARTIANLIEGRLLPEASMPIAEVENFDEMNQALVSQQVTIGKVNGEAHVILTKESINMITERARQEQAGMIAEIEKIEREMRCHLKIVEELKERKKTIIAKGNLLSIGVNKLHEAHRKNEGPKA